MTYGICKIVEYIRKRYPNSIIISQYGENQDTTHKRMDSCKKGYTSGQPDFFVADNHLKFKGFCAV